MSITPPVTMTEWMRQQEKSAAMQSRRPNMEFRVTDLDATVSQLSGRRRNLNGTFAVNQRGIASGVVLPPRTYSFDRWCGGSGVAVNLIANPTGGATVAYTNWTTDGSAGGGIAGTTATIPGINHQGKVLRSTMAAGSTAGFYLNGSTGATAPVVAAGLPLVVAGRSYEFTIWVNPSVTKTIAVAMQPYMENLLATAGGVTGTPVVCAAGTWTKLTVAFTASTQTTRVAFGASTSAWSAGQTLTFGAAMLVETGIFATPSAYFDGAGSGNSWAGTANASVSYNATVGNTTLTFTATPQGQTITIAGAPLGQVLERADVEAGTYVLSWLGTSQGRVYNAGTTPPSFAASGSTWTLDGLANVVMEFSAGTLGEVQIERGTVATTFERRSLGEELVRCQRYYYQYAPSQLLVRNPYWNVALSGGGMIPPVHPVAMRIGPNVTNTDGTVLLSFFLQLNTAGGGVNVILSSTGSDTTQFSLLYSSSYNAGASLAANREIGSNNNILCVSAEF